MELLTIRQKGMYIVVKEAGVVLVGVVEVVAVLMQMVLSVSSSYRHK